MKTGYGMGYRLKNKSIDEASSSFKQKKMQVNAY